MIEKNDWRLLNDIEHLYNQYMNPINGEELIMHTEKLKKCTFCWEPVTGNPHHYWYISENQSDCICEYCFKDFCEQFGWKKLDGWDINWE